MPRPSRRQKQYDDYEPRVPLNPEIKRGVGVIFLIVLSLLSILSYFKLAGTAGLRIDNLLAVIFGQTRLLAPAVMLLLAILMEVRKDYPYKSGHTLGFFLILLGVNGLAHLRYPLGESYHSALKGLGGGLAGFAGSYPLLHYFGFYAAVLVLLSLVISAALLLFNTSLGQMVQTPKQAAVRLAGAGRMFFRMTRLFQGATASADDISEPLLENQDLEKIMPTVEDKDSPRTTPAEPMLLADNAQTSNYKLQTTNYTRGLPPLNLLVNVKSQPSAGDINANQLIIEKTLGNFGIPVEMGEVRVGPSIGQYSLRPADGVKLSKITALHNDLAMALAAHPIRIEAPIPGKSLVGIEVPNRKVALVTLRELLESAEFGERRRKGELLIALGKDVAGKAWFANLSALPHLLVAGATGSGKTVCLNTIILSLLFQHTPQTLRFIMVDPKRVELPLYNGIPHLLTPVVTDVTKTVNALRWTIGEMERRFEILSKSGKRDIASYNQMMENKMPYLVFVVDELADLMAAAAAEIEACVIRLAQMARAVGIHLVLATQRPSVDIITGLIKANVPARLAFSVASLMDSRTILDAAGAEKLLGRGDMLWSAPDMSLPKRLQGSFVSEEEIKKVVDFFRGDEPPVYLDDITAKQQSAFVFAGESAADGDSDELLPDAKEVILQAGKASASLLQRRLKVGYARAARLLDLLEAQGFIGPGDGAKPREILQTISESNIISEDSAEIDETLDDEPTAEKI